MTGTGCIIPEDCTEKNRSTKGKLMAIRKEIIKGDGRIKTYLKSDTLVVESEWFKWDDEQGLICRDMDGVKRINQSVNKYMTNELSKGPLPQKL